MRRRISPWDLPGASGLRGTGFSLCAFAFVGAGFTAPALRRSFGVRRFDGALLLLQPNREDLGRASRGSGFHNQALYLCSANGSATI